MKVSKDFFFAYTHILRENGSTGDCLLTILEDIVNGEWDNSVQYCINEMDPNYDPMDDFNYAGSRHHYWSTLNNIEGGRDVPLFVALSSYALVTVTVPIRSWYDSKRCVLKCYSSRRY